MSKQQNLVPGHTLVAEGAPHMWNGRRYERNTGGEWTVSGTGKALCSCGWTSKVLKTGAARKAAHREHKRAMVTVTGDWTPDKVKAAIEKYYPFTDVRTSVSGEKVQVTMPFDDLCSFAEWICGSMSEFDLTGYVKEELAKVLKIGGSET